MTVHRSLLILGFGGHARSVADVALACGYEDLVFVDEMARPGEDFLGHPVFSSLDAAAQISVRDAFPAAGDNQKRSKQILQIRTLGFQLVSLVSPHASRGAGSVLAAGCFVGHHAHIGPMASIGCGAIVNTGAVVEHEARVGDYAHVSVNATMAGRSSLGAYSMLGAGAVIVDSVAVGGGVLVGAGAVVHRTVHEPGVYVGVPARKHRAWDAQ